MKKFTNCFLFFLLFFLSDDCFCQQKDSVLNNIQEPRSSISELQDIPNNYYSKVGKKINSVNDQLTKKSLKYLSKFQKQERKIQQKLQKLNPELIVSKADNRYNELSQKIKSKTAGATKIISGEYSPYLDSLGTSLSFLKQFNGISDKVKSPLNSFDQLQNKIQESEKIKAFIAERKNQIKEMLSKYTKLPAGLKNQYANLNKTAYYYSAQVKEYKDLLNDPNKMELKALAMLNQLPVFQKFLKENSVLAGLFNLPGNYGTTQVLAGLQTRDQIGQLIRNRMGGGPNAGQLFSQQLQGAQQGLQTFKDKLNKLGGGSGDIEMPDFKPNGQKTKSFAKRLEYGFNIQFARNNSIIPETSDLALSIGYKLDDKKVMGFGLSYKIGVGTIERIQFTSQGVGLRSFLDWKLKGKIYLSGGYEMNYNSAFKTIEQLKGFNAWQRSALFGLSKEYSIGKKRKGEIKILYDFLANSHIPTTQPFVFRTGYSLK